MADVSLTMLNDLMNRYIINLLLDAFEQQPDKSCKTNPLILHPTTCTEISW
jgi:hypothetical protein